MADVIQLGMANKDVVKRLMLHLTAAFEQFADAEFNETTDTGLQMMDALMGFHNAYKAFLLDLEQRAGDKHYLIRNTAVTTLEAALGVKASPAAQYVTALLRQVTEHCDSVIDDPILTEQIKAVLEAN